MASGTAQTPIKFTVDIIELDPKTISGGTYAEWSGVSVAKTGWYPYAVTRVRTNKSQLLISGFTLTTSTAKFTLLLRSIANSAITADETEVGILYCNQPLVP